MRRILFLCFLAILLTACMSNKELNKEEIQEAKPSKLPNVRAFQDENTRKHMLSTKEVKEGYYLYESRTERYTMHFPADMLFLDSITGEGKRSEIANFLYPYQVEELSNRGNELELYLKRYEEGEDLLSKIHVYPDATTEYVQDMERIDLEESTIYHTQMERAVDEDGVRQYIVGVIGSKEVPQAIYFDVQLGTYPKDERLSKETLDRASDELLELIKTIKFIDR